MADSPSGTVTFLFTDIEGSTRLGQQFPAGLPAALAGIERQSFPELPVSP